jgi:hypothetical protein
MGSFIQPEAICILLHIGSHSVFVGLCSRMCGHREWTVAVRLTNLMDSGCSAHESGAQINSVCLSIEDQSQSNQSCTGCSLAV